MASKAIEQITNFKKRGRKRDESLHVAVLDATLEMLWEVGYKNLSIEKISKCAGVTKVTIYKWWESLPCLVLESLEKKFHMEDKMPDTGTLEGDLLIIVGTGLKKSPPKKQEIMRYLMAESQINPAFKKVFDEKILLMFESFMMHVFERAQTRGEISSNLRLEFLCDICAGFYWYTILAEKKFDPKEIVSFIMNAVKEKNN